MKGKRYTTEDKIRILREADRGEKSIQNLCQEANISEVSFHRWKRQFGHMEVNEARRRKELERENRELKEMLADSLHKNRVLEAVCEKNCKPGPSAGRCGTVGGGGDVFRAQGMPIFEFARFAGRPVGDFFCHQFRQASRRLGRSTGVFCFVQWEVRD